MARTILCPHCKSTFDEDVLAKRSEPNICPVCEKDLWNEEVEPEKNDLYDELEKANESMMHVNQVHYPDDQMEGFIRIQCKKCLDFLYLGIGDAESIKEDYIKLKPDSNVECEKCGYKHTERYLTYCETVSSATPLPRCPVCNSAMLKKITTGSKLLAAATIGAFALPYNSKTFECKDCGYRF